MSEPQPSLFPPETVVDASEGAALPDHGDADLENQSGLGRGLEAIIPKLSGLEAPPAPEPRGGLSSLIPRGGGEDAGGDERPEDEEPQGGDVERSPDIGPAPDTGAVRQLRDDLVRALLDGLANTMRLDLCVYLHRDGDHPLDVFLRAPELSALGPQRAWELFEVLRDRVDAAESGPFAAAGVRGVTMANSGRGSTGLYVLARVAGLSEDEQGVAERFCSSFGRAVHQLGSGVEPRAGDVPVELEVHEARDSVLARVRVADGQRSRPGQGRAATRVEAITRAVIDAVGSGAAFRYASEVAHQRDHAAVVLVESPDGAVALGSAVVPAGPGRATAEAALRAVTAVDEA